ncbi:hypothetical protein [Bradyrhizobium prioriisuperbiae]|uniref:hypothetical protein n=1 Tax=Bradyrhizobium prioriisuperbiae TaxID=2854389 RepID=UPI0028E38B7C|nr:hypothetical protein [Bradyrhizobium prioritasuperba]
MLMAFGLLSRCTKLRVIVGLDPAIQLPSRRLPESWMRGASSRMTVGGEAQRPFPHPRRISQ